MEDGNVLFDCTHVGKHIKRQLFVEFTFLKRDQQQKDALCYGVRFILLQLLQQTNKQLFGSAGLENHKEHCQVSRSVINLFSFSY